MDLVLASSSIYRRSLLERLGLPFSCVAPDVDEASFKHGANDPMALARTLARAKAEAVARSRPASTVIGSDQLVALDDAILGKPGSFEMAVEQLLSMSGRTHRLITAAAVVHRGRWAEHVDVTRMTVRRLKPNEVERYVRADQPLDCAGAYKLESRGIALFERIESEDHSAITGLPLIWITTVLRGFGFDLP